MQRKSEHWMFNVESNTPAPVNGNCVTYSVQNKELFWQSVTPLMPFS